MNVPRVGEAGGANASAYHAAARAVLARHPQLDEFAVQVDGALPGTNVDAEKVLCFDEAQAILHIRALFTAQADGDTAAGLAAFEAQYWSRRRQAFEDLWQDGRRFVYCAPNPGALGALKYGDYCLIVDPATLEQADTAVFPSDTAQTYTNDTALVDCRRSDNSPGVAVTEFPRRGPRYRSYRACGGVV